MSLAKVMPTAGWPMDSHRDKSPPQSAACRTPESLIDDALRDETQSCEKSVDATIPRCRQRNHLDQTKIFESEVQQRRCRLMREPPTPQRGIQLAPELS